MLEPARIEAPVVRTRPAGGLLEVANLAHPVVLATLAETVMQVVNSAMVGRLGAT